MTVRILHGDALEQLRTLADESVHSIVTDPPYGLEFMGKEWDSPKHMRGTGPAAGFGQVNMADGADRLDRPSFMGGGQLTCMNCGGDKYRGATISGGRARKKCECAAPSFRNVGSERGKVFQEFCEAWARECLRVLKPGGHLLSFGGSRTYHRMACAIEDAGFEIRDQIMWIYGSGFPKSLDVSKAIDKAAPRARQWQGWGTALKPAHEPIVVARKPLIGTVAANVLKHGTGAINVDACRIEGSPKFAENAPSRSKSYLADSGFVPRAEFGGAGIGRWPANIIHDGSDEVLAGFPAEAGAHPVGLAAGNYNYAQGGQVPSDKPFDFGDSGSAARFFYTAKASRDDRNIGCDDLDAKPLNWSSGTQSPGTFQSPNTDRSARNHHPTVKPTDLMQYLVRLVTPPGGTVLDPFAGSGSTGLAADREGFDAILIEREAEYVEIARRRIVGDCPLFAELAA